MEINHSKPALKEEGLLSRRRFLTVASFATAAYDAKWGTWVVDNKTFISLVYFGI